MLLRWSTPVHLSKFKASYVRFSSRMLGNDGAFFEPSSQNYDLSVSEAPKLFSDAEFEAVKRIQDGLKVLVLRKRLQVRESSADPTGQSHGHTAQNLTAKRVTDCCWGSQMVTVEDVFREKRPTLPLQICCCQQIYSHALARGPGRPLLACTSYDACTTRWHLFFLGYLTNIVRK